MTSMKDKCLIAATALVIIVATTPVLSGLALAQQPKSAVLIVKVFNRANCDNTTAKKCPAYNNMITTVNIRSKAGFWKSESFPAGPCQSTESTGRPCIGPTKEYQVHVGDGFLIEAKEGSKPNCGGSVFHKYTCVLEPIHFVSNPAPGPNPILGRPNCGNIETGTGACTGTVPDSAQITVEVNYHWRYD